MKATKKALALLHRQFTKDGKVAYSGVHTSEGTMPLWGQLVQDGLVKAMPPVLHPFGYMLTDAGRDFLNREKEVA